MSASLLKGIHSKLVLEDTGIKARYFIISD